MSAHLTATGLSRHFTVSRGVFTRPHLVQAVSDISFELQRGETLGLVGESGCGKSTVGRLLLGLLPPSAGRVHLGDLDVTAHRGEALRRLRRRMQMVFQDPSNSLNPRMTIGEAVEEPLRAHLPDLQAAERRARALAQLQRVGLAESHLKRLPGELSGGQKQRVALARALIAEPEFIFADEPVSALDVSVQAQIVNLLGDLQRERQLTLLFVSHDLRVVEHVSTRVAVMYLGRLVEVAPRRTLFSLPAHPYTRALLSAVPDPRPGRPPRVVLEGDLPSPFAPPSGCAFHPRCPLRKRLGAAEQARCRSELPALRPTSRRVDESAAVPSAHPEPVEGRLVACHFWDAP